MQGKIHVEELLPETRRKLKLDSAMIKPKHLVLGRILVDLQLLSRREAVWALRTALNLISGRTWTSHRVKITNLYKKKG